MSKRPSQREPPDNLLTRVARCAIAEVLAEVLPILDGLLAALDRQDAELAALLRARRKLSLLAVRLALKAVARHRKPVNLDYYERLRQMHKPPRQSYAWIARKEGLERDAVRYAIRVARGYQRPRQ